MKFIVMFISVLSIILFAQTPHINSISGHISEGADLTIFGNNFGAEGPHVILFDNFSRGAVGDTISLEAPVGAWSGHNNYYLPYFIDDNEGNMAGHLIKNDSTRQLYITFEDVQEIFFSYRVSIPFGSHFPNSKSPNTFPEGSQWKITWLMDGERGSAGNDDIVLPTWGNGTYFSLAGNDNAFQLATGRPGTESNWFSFLGWNRFTVYMKGGEVPTVDSGIVWSQGMSEEFGQKVFQAKRVLFDGKDSPDSYQFEDDSISRWNYLKVPGWHRSGDPKSAAMYDDIYLAIGENAQARVEIGDKSTYDSCTLLALSTPKRWSDTLIDLTVRQGTFADGDTGYLYIIDTEGNVNELGYKVIFGQSVAISSSFQKDGLSEQLFHTRLDHNIYMIQSPLLIQSIHVFDILGRTIYERSDTKSKTITVDLQRKPAGVYCFTIETERGDITRNFVAY